MRVAICCVVGAVFIVASVPLFAQQFETAATNPGDDDYYQPPYPIVFVAAEILEVPDWDGSGTQGKYHFGTGVLSANNPDKGHQLWILLPDGTTKKLFPLQQHEDDGLLASPPGEMWRGAVVEPNVSEDGTRVYFAFFHDTTFTPSSGSEFDRISYKGADLYSMDLGPLLADPAYPAEDLVTRRLTDHVYGGNGQQLDSDKFKDALNPALATNGTNNWGTVYFHAVEMRTAEGLKLVYASDERRVKNSNSPMANANHNFNLHIADLNADGSISNRRQLLYYTTTSALSPTPLRNGIAFSYQASTEGARNWHVQGMDSEGRWYPLVGYGSNPDLFHLGGVCVDTKSSSPGDYFVVTKYYNANNEGFGALYKQEMAVVGRNEYDVQTQWVVMPRQVGLTRITTGVVGGDNPSGKQGGVYVGKLTTPRCGVPDDLFMAYTQTSANGRLNDEEGNRSIYHSYITYRPNLEPFHPLDPVDVANELGQRTVIRDVSNTYSLAWPVPILSWQARMSTATQDASPLGVDPQTTIATGMPHAQVGTSALDNTDRRPFDCWLGPAHNPMQPYSPNQGETNINQENDQLINNQDGLTWIQNPSNPCEALVAQSILGIAVNLTGNKTDMAFNEGFEAGSGGRKEPSKLLGVYDVRSQADTSFEAVVPARAPFEFHLLDRQYGMRLADVRSWHSLEPRETRTDCGGCHNHEPGAAIEFEGTVADLLPPLDMVTATSYLDYDASCNPILQTSSDATRDVPEWTGDVYPGFDAYCGSCHNASLSSNADALEALDYTNEQQAFDRLTDRNFVDTKVGAIGSPAFWAARGHRTDNRPNTDPKFAPDYANDVWGYFYSSVHDSLGLCSGTDPTAAQWVYRLGQWIDHHHPRDTGASSYGAQYDWYHPSVDAALPPGLCGGGSLQIGVWDDTGGVTSLELWIDGVEQTSWTAPSNGAYVASLPALGSSAALEIVAIDGASNRQVYRTSFADLQYRCTYDPTGAIFVDGFESGDTSAWSG